MVDLHVGDKAPEFTLPDAHGEGLSLASFKGKWVLLYFYPKDNTPGCTIEAQDFTKLIKEFNKLDAVIVGISPDSPESHCRFIDGYQLKHILLSDPKHEVLAQYGVWTLKKNYGKEYMGVARTSVMIDPQGKIAFIWPKVQVAGHADAVREKLLELKKGRS